MQTQDPIRNFERRLARAIAEGQWDEADLAIERLKTLLLAALVSGDSPRITSLQRVLSDAGELLELRNGLAMQNGAQGLAWKLRADVGTAVIGNRMRPEAPSLADIADWRSLRDKILELLRGANRPMNNSQIAQRLDRDPAIVSRTLKRLLADKLIRQWKMGAMLFNALTDAGREQSSRIERIIASQDMMGTMQKINVVGKGAAPWMDVDADRASAASVINPEVADYDDRFVSTSPLSELPELSIRAELVAKPPKFAHAN